jgi:hypothetical protein
MASFLLIAMGILSSLSTTYKNMTFLPKILAAAAFALVSLSASAAPIHALNDQAPVGFGTNTLFSNAVRGWEFTAGASNLYVSQLGLAPASGGSYTLSLWAVTGQSLLAQTVLNSTSSGEWNWANLSSSVALTQGASYLVTGHGNDAGQSYYFANNLASSWYPTGDINYTTAKYCNGCSANTYPLNALAGYQYGLVDIGYTAGTTSVPEPGSLAMLGLGLLAIGAIRRKKSA